MCDPSESSRADSGFSNPGNPGGGRSDRDQPGQQPNQQPGRRPGPGPAHAWPKREARDTATYHRGPNRRVSIEVEQEILRLYKTDEYSYREIERKLHVCRWTISRVVNAGRPRDRETPHPQSREWLKIKRIRRRIRCVVCGAAVYSTTDECRACELRAKIKAKKQRWAFPGDDDAAADNEGMYLEHDENERYQAIRQAAQLRGEDRKTNAERMLAANTIPNTTRNH